MNSSKILIYDQPRQQLVLSPIPIKTGRNLLAMIDNISTQSRSPLTGELEKTIENPLFSGADIGQIIHTLSSPNTPQQTQRIEELTQIRKQCKKPLTKNSIYTFKENLACLENQQSICTLVDDLEWTLSKL